jgi:hypothetical protein
MPIQLSLKNTLNTASNFEKQAQIHADQGVRYFKKTTRSYALFNILFFVLFFLQLLGILLFFPFFAKSSLVAFALASLFLTVFSYFVLRFYLQGKKPEQLILIKEEFLSNCNEALPSYLEPLETHRYLIRMVYYLIKLLDGLESRYYSLPDRFKTIAPLLQKFSLWCHWQDVHAMKEILHEFCIQESVNWVKKEPLNVDIHILLAEAYSAFYKEYLSQNVSPLVRKHLSTTHLELYTARALEELKIIKTYAPDNAWVYSQQVVIYHDLNQPEKELEALEALLLLSVWSTVFSTGAHSPGPYSI